jgi:hypothetical protein
MRDPSLITDYVLRIKYYGSSGASPSKHEIFWSIGFSLDVNNFSYVQDDKLSSTGIYIEIIKLQQKG